MKVPSNPVPFGQHVELAHPALCGGQLPGQRGLIGEGGHYVELFVAEWARPVVARHDNDTRDGVSGPQRQDERRPGTVDTFQLDPVDPPRGARREGISDRCACHPDGLLDAGSHCVTDSFDQLRNIRSGVSSSTGTTTMTAAAPVSSSAFSAMSRNTVAGSAPDNSSG